MSLVIPMVFIIVFIILLSIFTDVFSLLIYSIFLIYVFVNYDTFFTDTMSATILNTLQLLTGTIAVAGIVKMIIRVSGKYQNLFGEVEE